MLSILLLCLLQMYSCKGTAQVPELGEEKPVEEETSNYRLIADIETDASVFATDNLGHIYLAGKDGEVLKYDSEGKELFQFSDFNLGDVHMIDASSPFNILVFYRDDNVVVFLDRTLQETARVDLFLADQPQVNAVAVSLDQNIWLYDPLEFSLKKLDKAGNVVYQSPNMSQYLDEDFEADFLLEFSGEIAVGKRGGNIFRFDLFGGYIGKEDFKVGKGRLKSIKEAFVFVNESDELEAYKPLKSGFVGKKTALPKSDDELLDAMIRKNHLYILRQGKLSIFNFE